MGICDHGDDTCKQGICTDLLSSHDESTGAIDGCTDDPVADNLLHRYRFARDHRLIDHTGALQDQAINRNFLAGPNSQAIVNRDVAQANIVLAAVRIQAARGRGGHTQ